MSWILNFNLIVVVFFLPFINMDPKPYIIVCIFYTVFSIKKREKSVYMIYVKQRETPKMPS